MHAHNTQTPTHTQTCPHTHSRAHTRTYYADTPCNTRACTHTTHSSPGAHSANADRVGTDCAGCLPHLVSSLHQCSCIYSLAVQSHQSPPLPSPPISSTPPLHLSPFSLSSGSLTVVSLVVYHGTAIDMLGPASHCDLRVLCVVAMDLKHYYGIHSMLL